MTQGIATGLALLLAGGLLGCGDAGGLESAPAGTPVIVISVDTLRSDRLPAYGYGGVATPAFDALRRDSILFEKAFAHVPLTLPSHASLFTGMLPAEHGVRDNLGYRLDGPGLPSLPRALRDAGYATGGAISAYVLRRATGIAEGFDFFDDHIRVVSGTAVGSLQRPGNETLQAALPWMRSVRDRPFFLFFHIYEPHSPYTPPEPFASRYESPYDGEVAAADAIVGELIAELQELGLYEEALIVLVSDHGEGLGDHGEQEHEILLYREYIQVPLLLKLPGGRRGGDSVARPVGLTDVLPTVAELLDLEGLETEHGRSLLETQPAADRRIYSENFYPRLHFGWSELVSLADSRYHFIFGPDPELYDMVEDPRETRSILLENRQVTSEMRRALDGYDRSLAPPGVTDPEVQARLAALGYVGAVGGETTGPRADPKSRIHVIAAMSRAFRLFSQRDFAAAAEAFRAVLDEEPLLVDAWEHYAKSLRTLGRREEAATAFAEALRLSAGSPGVALAAADLYLEMGQLEEARRHAELARETYETASDLLAQIALRQGDLAEAEAHSERAMRERGTRIEPLITRAQLLLAQGRAKESIAVTDTVETEFGTRTDRNVLRGLYQTRGDAFARLGRPEDAERAYQREIRLSPDALSSYTRLAYLYALLDRAADVGATLKQMVETNPQPLAYAEAARTLRAIGDPRSAAALLAEARRRWPTSPDLGDLED